MELNRDQMRTGKPNMDMEGETRSRKAQGEQNTTQVDELKRLADFSDLF